MEPIRFNKIAVQLPCPGVDPAEPVYAELTARGDLVFHNWDREADLAALELGFKVEDLPCLALEENYYLLFEDDHTLADLTLHQACHAFYAEALRVKAQLRQRGEAALENSGYGGPPAPVVIEQQPLSGERLRYVWFEGLNPTGQEAVTGGVKKLFSVGVQVVASLAINIHTTVQSYMDVLRFIPSGLVLEKGRKWGWNRRILVAAIDKVLAPDKLFVVAGRQLPDQRIESRRALVTLSHPSKQKWRVEKWLA